MVKRVAAEDKSRDANERRNNSENETRREKYASNIIIQDENKKARDIMENAQFMMKESHEKQRSHQCGVDLLMFFHKNERQLKRNNNEKVVSHIQTK